MSLVLTTRAFALALGASALTLPALGHAQTSPAKPGSTSMARASDTPTEETTDFGGDENKVICKRQKVIGSRVRASKVCKTAKQWDIERQESRYAVEKGQNQRTLTGN